ncbi:MAG: malonic semialdehyde reductase [Alphaproteobacteria bacterium]|nr:malonic semialdehyde reductase [Alphaproteobacteria bacterium]
MTVISTKNLTDHSIAQIFTEARTHNGWSNEPIGDDILQKLYDLAKYPPTSFNCQPARYLFVKSKAAKEKLAACLLEGNVAKTLAAPVCVIVAYDSKFFDHLPKTFPQFDAKSVFVNNPAMAEATQFRNSSMSGAYMILAARALGLDCGAMSGFNNDAVDQAFFAGTSWKSNFLINMGYGGDPSKIYPRNPRLDFAEACKVV